MTDLPVLPGRAELLRRFASDAAWDVVVIGGGATGLGVALDAAARGFAVALVERDDFATGTSSRSTKLVHGGVRYLAQGRIGLVREALRERRALLDNAPHLAQPLPFVLPLRGARGRWLDRWFYAAGLFAYDRLAGAEGFGRTELLGPAEALARVPGLRATGLAGGIRYWDGQFDDARLALALARTAIARGAAVVNHCAAVALEHANGRVAGVVVEDGETGTRHRLRAGCVINATGVWVDAVRRFESGVEGDLVAPSRGVHLVVPRRFLPGGHALLMPGTADGRVLFAIPWFGATLLGTTDTPCADLATDPAVPAGEVDFILREAARHLATAPRRADVLSVWAGLRPLVGKGNARATGSVSREHTVQIAPSGLVTVTGGKWTTYRAMAEDVLARCAAHGLLAARPPGVTQTLRLHGAPAHAGHALARSPGLHLYGAEAPVVAALPGHDRELAPGLTEAMVRFAVRHEYARGVDDVLARRSRLLFLDAARAASAAGPVAAVLAEELGAPFDAAASRDALLAIAARHAPPT